MVFLLWLGKAGYLSSTGSGTAQCAMGKLSQLRAGVSVKVSQESDLEGTGDHAVALRTEPVELRAPC